MHTAEKDGEIAAPHNIEVVPSDLCPTFAFLHDRAAEIRKVTWS
jgi:hypothetical protein